MSVYEKRYCLTVDDRNFYTDDAEQVVLMADLSEGSKIKITEGYAEYREADDDILLVVRRTTGKVLLSTLRYQVERAKVEAMLR